MRRALLLPLGCALMTPLVLAAEPIVWPDLSDHVTAAAIIREMNLARQNPTLYATFVAQTRQNYSRNACLMPGRVGIRTHQGVRAVDEAIRFLRQRKPLPPLALSPALCLAAAEHCRDQATGAIGHYGSNRSNPGNRITRYGTVTQGWAENISYGKRSARDIVTAFIIDDGVRSRGHRKNIFNPNYNVAGAAFGPHARFGTVCSIDFASGYSESTFVHAENEAEKVF